LSNRYSYLNQSAAGSVVFTGCMIEGYCSLI